MHVNALVKGDLNDPEELLAGAKLKKGSHRTQTGTTGSDGHDSETMRN